MTMKKKLAIVVCSVPFALAPIAYAQTGGTVEGTTSPQSGNQTDMGADGASNSDGTAGSASSGSNAPSNASSNGGTTNTNDTTSRQSSSSSAPESGSSASGSSASSAGSTGGDSTTSGAPAGDAASNAGAGNASGSTTPSGSDTTPSTSSSSGNSATTGSSAGATPDPASGESFDAKLKGKSVYNENDEKVGDVKDLVMSSDGKVTHVVLGVGGFIGVGEHPVAIPFDEINTTGDKLTLRGYTKEKLKEMPAYEYPKDDRSAAPAPATSGASPMGPR